MPAMNRPGFLTKAGLRRLLTSDEVWSFGRKRSSGEQIQTEQETLQQTTGAKDSCDPKRFLAYSHQSQPCHHVNSERKVKCDEGKPLHQHGPSKDDSKPSGYETETDKNIQSHLQQGQHHENVTPPKSSEIYSGEKIQYPSEVSWKPIKNVQHFTSGPQQNKTSCGITDRAPIVSSLSSDIEEDLPYDYEDRHSETREERDGKFQEALKTYSASKDTTVDCGRTITDNASLNVDNNQRSQTILLLNNNHEICGVPRKTESETVYARIWQNTKESIVDKPIIANLVQALSGNIKRGEESPSCDDSLSETEDKSEPFSLQSEALAWSEEERDVLNEEKTEASVDSLVFSEKFIVDPEPPSRYRQHSTQHNDVGPHDVYPNDQMIREMTADYSLSEILSPVDEVLSYGSAELPPSMKGGGGSGPNSNSLPRPPPAFEIITWTSEEDLPAPPDCIEDVSINSENFPNLPTDLSSSRRETRSLGSGSLGEGEVFNDGLIVDQTLPLRQTTGLDEEDEYSLLVDESNEIEDPLFSFHVGDRVLVCNSSPGVLKYKGPTAFAGGFWAGVELDTPNGNHNGTYRGVKYFTCEKNRGVLVRVEDVTHLSRQYCSHLRTGVVEDAFQEEPPKGQHGKNGERPSDSSGNEQERNRGSQKLSPNDPPSPKQEQRENASKDTSNELSSSSRSSDKSPLKVDHALLCYNEEKKHHVEESDALIQRLTEEIFADALKSAQDTRKRHRQIIESKHDSKPIDSGFRNRDNSSFATSKPRHLDQWHQVHPEVLPQIRVPPHEPSIVYKLVDATVEIYCGQAEEDALSACETPSYLVDDKSRKGYRQVLSQLASDVLHEVCVDVLDAGSSAQCDTSVTPPLQMGQISISYLKNAVKREIMKVLNLERTDQQMSEMLQTLCKYWYAKRDRVDYILIQELHSEERQWVDYSTDQSTVKTQLAEDIFRLLLDDTISVLNHIYLSDNK